MSNYCPWCARLGGMAIFVILLGSFALGCIGGTAPEAGVNALTVHDQMRVSTSEDLMAFFEDPMAGNEAVLTKDISLGDEMLTLTKTRGPVTLHGGGFTLSGGGACVIRLEDGAALTLNGAVIAGEQTGIGLIGSGILSGTGEIRAGTSALYGAGAITLGPDSRWSLSAQTGSGVLCAGLTLQKGAAATIEAALFGVSAGKGDIVLQGESALTAVGEGDNVIKTERTLRLEAGAALTATNAGAYNAAKIGTLAADPAATISLHGGEAGVSLFVVEQTEDVTLLGSCNKDVQVEFGSGKIAFSS